MRRLRLRPSGQAPDLGFEQALAADPKDELSDPRRKREGSDQREQHERAGSRLRKDYDPEEDRDETADHEQGAVAAVDRQPERTADADDPRTGARVPRSLSTQEP